MAARFRLVNYYNLPSSLGKGGKPMEKPQVTMVVRSKMVELGDLGGSLTKSEMASENGNLGELTIRN